MKKIIAVVLAFALVFSFCACGASSSADNVKTSGETNNSKSESKAKKPIRVEVKGAFFMEEPHELINVSDDNLSKMQRYLLVVYDVINETPQNEELNTWDSAVVLKTDSGNEYKQFIGEKSNEAGLKAFMDYSGYLYNSQNITNNQDITSWGNGDPLRMIAPFAVNKSEFSDVTDGKITLDFDLSERIEDSISIPLSEIIKIQLFDDIFAVEEDPDAYQVARSVLWRAKNTYELIDDFFVNYEKVFKFKSKDSMELSEALNEMYKYLIVMNYLFECGITCSGGLATDEVPNFDIEKVRKIYPEIADEVEDVIMGLRGAQTDIEKDELGVPDLGDFDNHLSMALSGLETIFNYYANIMLQ